MLYNLTAPTMKQNNMLSYGMQQHAVLQHNMKQDCTIHHNTMQDTIVEHSSILCSRVQSIRIHSTARWHDMMWYDKRGTM